jgi:small subunit ribosomal protein S6
MPSTTSAILISLRTTPMVPRLAEGLLVPCHGFLPRPGPSVPGGAASGEADSDRGKETGNVNEYEILLLLDPDLDDDRQAEIVARARDLVEKSGGTWDLQDAWGRRKLAYEIRHKADGSYHLLHFTCDAGTLDEVSRVLRIDDGVMRHMATRRIQGSPVRPVAVGAPAREDATVASDVEEEEE